MFKFLKLKYILHFFSDLSIVKYVSQKKKKKLNAIEIVVEIKICNYLYVILLTLGIVFFFFFLVAENRYSHIDIVINYV